MAYTTIDKPSDYFETVLYTGNGSSLDVSGLDFQPDWTWIKSRTTTGYQNVFDAVRGSTKRIFANVSEAEQTVSNSLTSFNSNGFTVGSNGDLNGDSQSQVAWNWKAGTSFTNDASGTGVGSIDSAGSFNNDAGFSIFTFTGTGSIGTIKHGLNTKPDVIFIKGRSEAKAWTVYHSALGAGKALFLQSNAAAIDHPRYWNDVEPTTSVFTGGSSTNLTGSGITFVGYAFTAKQGYSKFGSYVGNGSTNGSYIHLGFKPAWVMFKRTSGGTSNWTMLDTKRSPHNLMINELYANHSNAESQNGRDIDCLSNGIKIRSSSAEINGSGDNYTFYAFAENPFVTSSGVPATAR